MRRHKTAGAAGARRFREGNRPPQDAAWIWFTAEMLNAPAWLALPCAARKVVEGVATEHMAHGGTMNGELALTYDQLAARGIRRPSIPEAIEIACRLGWIEVTFKGGRSYGAARRPSEYRLSWLPKSDGSPPTNKWKAFKTLEEAEMLVAAVSSSRRSRPSNSAAPSQDIRGSNVSVPRELDAPLRAARGAKALPGNKIVPRAPCGPGNENVPGEMPSARAAR